MPGYSGKARIEVYCLKPFLNSSYKDEAVEILRNLAAHDNIALDYLADINDPETEALAQSLSINGRNEYIRFRAREILKDTNIDTYISTLIEALNTETENRWSIYEGLLSTRRTDVYKYVLDLYNTNQYPADRPSIEQQLDNQWLLLPPKNSSITDLLDSLSSGLYQLHSFGWAGDLNFIQQLDSFIVNSKTYYQSGDTIESADQLKLLSTIIDMGLRDSAYNKFVNTDAWNFLYPQTLFIRKKINNKSAVDSLIGLSPESIESGSNSFTLTIKGIEFNNKTEAFWNGYPLVTTIISDSIIQAYVPSSNIMNPDESVTINVFNPTYRIQNKLTFRVIPESQNPNLLVNLKNSQGVQIPASSVKYYDTSWKDAVDNGDGTFTVITAKPTVSVRLFYEYASQTVNNIPAQNNTYTFHTVNTQVELENSSGQLIDEGTVKYYAGAWRDFGTTVNGVASKELLPNNYSFRMTYEYGSIDKQQNLSTNSIVDFTTVLCTVKVSDTQNQPLNNANVKYYGGAWRNLGLTNAEGTATKELLPMNISFRASYGNVSQDKQQDIGVNSLVEIVLNVGQ